MMAQQPKRWRTVQILAAIECTHREATRLSVPFVRAASNVVDQRMRAMAQVYELLVRNRKATKRDLFYEHKKMYGTQANFDRALSALCKHLNACRNELNVISCSRGFAIGNLRLFDGMDDDDVVVDFRSSPVALVDSLCHFNLVHSDAQFLLVVEKDAIFQRLVDEQFTHKFPCSILITGRGYPDFCTRQFLHWLSLQLPSLPMLALVDADPYGLEIFLTYKYGSSRSAVEAGALLLPRLRWLGFLPSEAQTLPIPHNQFLQLTEADRKRIERIAQRVNNNKNNRQGERNVIDCSSEERSLFNYELSVMLNSGHKLELEALCSISANYLSTVYLDNKLVPLNVAVACPMHNSSSWFNNNSGHDHLQQQQDKDFSDSDWSANDEGDDDKFSQNVMAHNNSSDSDWSAKENEEFGTASNYSDWNANDDESGCASNLVAHKNDWSADDDDDRFSPNLVTQKNLSDSSDWSANDDDDEFGKAPNVLAHTSVLERDFDSDQN